MDYWTDPKVVKTERQPWAGQRYALEGQEGITFYLDSGYSYTVWEGVDHMTVCIMASNIPDTRPFEMWERECTICEALASFFFAKRGCKEAKVYEEHIKDMVEVNKEWEGINNKHYLLTPEAYNPLAG